MHWPIAIGFVILRCPPTEGLMDVPSNGRPMFVAELLRRVGSGRAMALLGATLLVGVVGSHLLQDRVTSHLIARVVRGQTMKVHDHVRRFNQTLREAEQSVLRYAALIS